MSTEITFKKHGKWSSFSGPFYEALGADGSRTGVSVLGGFCLVGGGCRSQGRKTRHYSVFAPVGDGRLEVGSSYSLKGAQEIARRAVASIGYRVERQGDGTLAVYDTCGDKLCECGSFIAVRGKFPAAVS